MEPNGVFVPPSNDVYEYVVFRGSDIKELQMTQQKPAFVDPAIQDAAVCLSTSPDWLNGFTYYWR